MPVVFFRRAARFSIPPRERGEGSKNDFGAAGNARHQGSYVKEKTMTFMLYFIFLLGGDWHRPVHHPSHLLPCSDYCPGEPVPCIAGK